LHVHLKVLSVGPFYHRPTSGWAVNASVELDSLVAKAQISWSENMKLYSVDIRDERVCPPEIIPKVLELVLSIPKRESPEDVKVKCEFVGFSYATYIPQVLYEMRETGIQRKDYHYNWLVYYTTPTWESRDVKHD
jgi:hypothetical protein